MKKRILFFAVLFLASQMFSQISVEVEIPTVGLMLVTEKNTSSIENVDNGVWYIPVMTVLSNSGISVDYNFPSEDELRWFAGGNVIISQWGIAAGLEGGLNYELFQTNTYIWDLNTKFKAGLVFQGPYYLIQPSVSMMMMDPSRKGWNFMAGIVFYNMALFYKNEQNINCFKILNSIAPEIGFGYRF